MNFSFRFIIMFFFVFLASREIIEWHLPLTVERKTVSDLYWLKTPLGRSTVSRLNNSHRPARQLARYRARLLYWVQLNLFQRGGVIFRNYSVVGSLAQSRLISRHAHGVNPGVPLGLESHFGPIRHSIVALPHSPKDHWNAQDLQRHRHKDNVETVGRDKHTML